MQFLTTFLRKLTKMRSKHVITFIVIASKLHRNMLPKYLEYHGTGNNGHRQGDEKLKDTVGEVLTLDQEAVVDFVEDNEET